MIAGLRARHRATFSALALVLPLGFAAAMVSRPPAQPTVDIGFDRSYEFAPGGTAWSALAVIDAQVEGLAFDVAPGWVRLHIADDLARPDVLLYWAPDPGDTTLTNATLLGEAAGRGSFEHRLPPPAGRGRGEFVLYSLGHHQVLARARGSAP